MEYSCDEQYTKSGTIIEKILKIYKKMDPLLENVFDSIIMTNNRYTISSISCRDIEIATIYLGLLAKERASLSPRIFFRTNYDKIDSDYDSISKGLYLAFKYNYKYKTWYIYDSIKHKGIYIINMVLMYATKI